MSVLRRAAGAPAAALYLRLPARVDVTGAPGVARRELMQPEPRAYEPQGGPSDGSQSQHLPHALPFALAVRGRVQQQGVARLDALSEAIRQSQRVVLLIAASDVTVLRIAVPPLAAHKLRQALPALVEDRIIGDTADCVLAAGAATNGQRTVAVVERRWLEQWAAHLRRLGAQRLSACPLQLCLPFSAGRATAWLFDFSHELHHSRELALRLSEGEGVGLPLGDARSEAASVVEVLRTASGLAAGKPLHLSVPADELAAYREALGRHNASLSEIVLRAATWSDLIDGAAQSDIDLIAGIVEQGRPATDWRCWRLPFALALAFLSLNVFAINWDWWQLHREGRRLASDMLRTYRSAFPGDSASDDVVLADPLARMKQKRIAQRRAAGEPSPGDFLSLSAALGDAWPAIQQATGLEARAVVSMEYRDTSLLLRFRPGSQPSLDAARKVLSARQLELSSDSTTSSWTVRSSL